jgi:osmotically-inducible protein OsmY
MPFERTSHDRRPPATSGIEESVECRLRGSPYLALRDVGCAYRDGVLTLRGCLPTYYLKQMAQEVSAVVEGVRSIANEIEVIGTRRAG